MTENQFEKKSGKNPEKKQTSPKESNNLLAAVLIRSTIGFESDVKKTLERLNLHDRLNCVLVPDNPVQRGMLKKAANVIAWGTISDDVVQKMASVKKRRGKAYCLHPPRGGFERQGIKVHFRSGGALGKRPSMDSLIQKMI